MNAPRLELVVSRHTEDLAWLRRVPAGIVRTVYDKGDGSSGGIRLPNVGREAHTHLHHLAERRATVAEVSVFVQGHPFDHAPDLHSWLRALADGTASVDDFHWLGFVADSDDPRGRRLFVPWSKNPERRELDLEGFHWALFGEPGPESYRFFPGGQFAVTRQAVHTRPADFYRHARDLAAEFPDGPHCFERCWDRVFMADGTAGRLPPGQTTAYFKPIRRLAAGKDPLVPPTEAR